MPTAASLKVDFLESLDDVDTINAFDCEVGPFGETETKRSGYVILPVWNRDTLRELRLVSKANNAIVVGTITATQIDNFFTQLGTGAYKKREYAQVKELDDWQTIYGVHSRSFPVLDKSTGHIGLGVGVPAVGCRRKTCGIVLPLRNMTVDHQAPKSNGGPLAMMRVFRAWGLTRKAPTGPKGLSVIATKAALVGGIPAPAGNGLLDKSTTNDRGVIYYSVIKWANQQEDLQEVCTHHYLNLAPACNSCNSSMGNR